MQSGVRYKTADHSGKMRVMSFSRRFTSISWLSLLLVSNAKGYLVLVVKLSILLVCGWQGAMEATGRIFNAVSSGRRSSNPKFRCSSDFGGQ